MNKRTAGFIVGLLFRCKKVFYKLLLVEHLKLCKIAVQLLCICGIFQPEEEIHQYEYDDHAPGDGEDNLNPSRSDYGGY